MAGLPKTGGPNREVFNASKMWLARANLKGPFRQIRPPKALRVSGRWTAHPRLSRAQRGLFAARVTTTDRGA
jgi:hypothetical protein